MTETKLEDFHKDLQEAVRPAFEAMLEHDRRQHEALRALFEKPKDKRKRKKRKIGPVRPPHGDTPP